MSELCLTVEENLVEGELEGGELDEEEGDVESALDERKVQEVLEKELDLRLVEDSLDDLEETEDEEGSED